MLGLDLRIRVRFVGFLARRIGREETVELEEGTTLLAAVRQVSEKHGFGVINLESGGDPGRLVVLLNGRSQNPNVKLKEMDEIAFLPTMAGG